MKPVKITITFIKGQGNIEQIINDLINETINKTMTELYNKGYNDSK